MRRNEFNLDDVAIAMEMVGKTEKDALGNEWTHPIAWSCGSGWDSATGIVRMKQLGIRPDLIIMADVGAEHPHTWKIAAAIDEWCQSVGFPELVVTSYYSEVTRYQTLEGNCLQNEGLPSLAYGGHSCSLKWKIRAIEDCVWGLEGWEPAKAALGRGVRVTRCIGYDYGCADSKRFAKIDRIAQKEAKKGIFQHWINRYPLREWKLSREDLPAIIESQPDFLDIVEKHTGERTLRKSSCFLCPAMKVAEVEEMATDYPDLALRCAVMEHRAATGKHGLITLNGLGLGKGPGHKWDKVGDRRNWSWSKHLVEVGLLPGNWRELALERDLIPADWNDYVAKASSYRARVEATRLAEFDAALTLPAALLDLAYPPKKRQSRKKTERENRGNGMEAAKRKIEKRVAGTKRGRAYVAARAATKRAEKAKKNLLPPDWASRPKPKPTKEVLTDRREAKRLFRAAVSKAEKLCAVNS